MQSTRQEILEILKEERQATVEDLAERLELTPMTIRHHLTVLQAQSLVVAAQVHRSQRVGRPRLVYTPTEAADDLFPQGYGELARHLVGEVKDSMGADKAQELLSRVAERIAGGAPPLRKGETFEERLDEVAKYLGGYGFLLHWEKAGEGYALTNLNCPYRRVAHEHAELCAMDTILLRKLLGAEVHVVSRQREGHPTCRCLLVPPTDG